MRLTITIGVDFALCSTRNLSGSASTCTISASQLRLDEKADAFALLLLLAVTGGHQHELAGGAQRLLDRAQHRAVERAVQLRDEHADAVRVRVASDCAMEFG